MVLPVGFEPTIFAVRGRCPGPLDDGGHLFFCAAAVYAIYTTRSILTPTVGRLITVVKVIYFITFPSWLKEYFHFTTAIIIGIEASL